MAEDELNKVIEESSKSISPSAKSETINANEKKSLKSPSSSPHTADHIAASESINDIENSIKSLSSSSSTKSRIGRKRKQMKDPSAPKRNMSSFMWFSLEERSKIKAEMPEIGHLDILKELGKRWTECPMDCKIKFEEIAANDRMRYESEKTVYSKKKSK